MAELGTQALISAGFSERISSTQTHRAAYDEFRESFWAIQAKEDAPAAVVRPASVTELSEVVKVLGDVNVKNGFTTPFAIRSGGHTPWPGSASIAGGVAVDLRSLRRVEVTDGGVVIGSGSLWEDVYGTLDPLNLTVPGARVARCGVTGLAMGGGISYYSPRTGWVCDSVLDFEVVLADGQVVHANLHDHSDLFKALKGGGNNFGVVTSMTMRTVPNDELWSATLVSDWSHMPTYLDIFSDLIGSPDYDENAAILITPSWAASVGKVAHAGLIYTKPISADTQPDFYKRFFEIPTMMSSVKNVSLRDSCEKDHERFTRPRMRRAWMTTSFLNDKEMLRVAIAVYEKNLVSIERNPRVAAWPMCLNPVVPAATKRSNEAGGNSLGFGPDQTVITATVMGSWENAEDDSIFLGISQSIIEGIEAEAKRLGKHHPFIYMNYAWKGQKVIDGYGDASKRLLQETSKKYDPRGIFQKAVPGGHKLFD